MPEERTDVQQTVALADKDSRRIRAMQAEVQACLALNRAMLHALASLSPLLNTAADVALEEEAERRPAGDRALEIIEQVRQGLQRSPAEARLARALERALVEAADAIPDDEPVRRRA
jgi:hypothetical protein